MYRGTITLQRITLTASCLIALIALAVHIWVRQLEHIEMSNARRELAGISSLLADHTDRTMQSVELALDVLVGKIERVLNERGSDATELHFLLNDTFASLPQIRSGIVLDAAGTSIGDGSSLVPRLFNGADRQFFGVHASGPSAHMYISDPVASRINGLWNISVSRRLEAPDGRFIGAVVAAVDPSWFSGLYRAATTHDGVTVTLMKRNGVIMATTVNDVPSYLSASYFAAAPEVRSVVDSSARGHIISPSPYSGDERLAAFAHAATYPVTIVVGRTTDAIADDATWAKATALVGGLAISVFIAFSAWVFSQHIVFLRKTQRIASLARRKALRAATARSQFLAAMSHELRTPLNAIIGFSQVLRREVPPLRLGARTEYAGYIEEAGLELLAHVEDLLDQAAIDARRIKLDIEEIDPSEVLSTSMRLIRSRASARGVSLAVATDDPRVRVLADRRRLGQVVLNLVTNAVKFTPPGGAVSMLLICSSDGAVTLRVCDEGVGMSSDEIETALAPFGRVDNPMTRKSEGTGLGLPIAKSLTELLGAHFRLSSVVGHGTTIDLIFRRNLVRRAS